MERLGLGYEEVRKFNPGIIYAELSGFGRSGPYANRAGFDLIAQGMSGIMSITGEGDGGPAHQVRSAALGHHRRHPRRHGRARGLLSTAPGPV